MNIVFMGTPDFAVPSLMILAEEHNIMAVVTQPDKPKGRNKKILFTPVKEIALKLNIPVFQPENINDENFLLEHKDFAKADFFVVAAYGQIFKEKLLNMPKQACINIHASLLPMYRGAAPIQRALIDGKTETGITIMYMEKGLDTGDMLLKNRIPISLEDTTEILHDKLAELGASSILEVLELFNKNLVKREKQDDSKATYATMLTKETGLINWEDTAENIVNIIRGVNPSPGAYSYYNNNLLKIWKATISSKEEGNIGEIIEINKEGIFVKTGKGSLILEEIQKQGGKKMPSSDFLRGTQISVGEIFKNA